MGNFSREARRFKGNSTEFLGKIEKIGKFVENRGKFYRKTGKIAAPCPKNWQNLQLFAAILR